MVGKTYPGQGRGTAASKRRAAESAKARQAYAKSPKATKARKSYAKRYGKPATSTYKTAGGGTVTVTTYPSGQEVKTVTAPTPVKAKPTVQKPTPKAQMTKLTPRQQLAYSQEVYGRRDPYLAIQGVSRAPTKPTPLPRETAEQRLSGRGQLRALGSVLDLPGKAQRAVTWEERDPVPWSPGKTIAKVRFTTPAERALTDSREYEQAFRETKFAERGRLGMVKKLATEWVPGGELALPRKRFEKGVTTRLEAAGYSPSEAAYAGKIAGRERKARELTEVGTVFAANVASEIVAKAIIGKQFTKLGMVKAAPKVQKWLKTKALAKGLAPAGAVEATAVRYAEIKSDIARPTVKQLGVAAAGGAVVATAIGVPVAFGSKALYRGALVLDPIEAPADVFAARIWKGRDPFKIVVPTATVDQTIFYGRTGKGVKAKTPTVTATRARARARAKAGAPVRYPGLVPTRTKTPSLITTRSLLPTPTPTPTYVPSTGRTPTFVPTPAMVPTPGIVPAPGIVPTPTPTPTPTFTPSLTVGYTPTFVFDRGLPPVPGWASGPWRGRKRARRGLGIRTGYRPSLAGVATGITIPKAPKVTTGIGIRYPVTPKKKAKKKKKKGKKR